MSNTSRINNASLLALVSSYKEGHKAAFTSIARILCSDVNNIARKYAAINEGRGNFAEDYRQEALVGLVKAVGKFTEEGGASFRTFAVKCMVNEVKAFIKEGHGLIRITSNIAENISKIEKAENSLLLKGNTNPSMEELWAASGIESEVTFNHAMDARLLSFVTSLNLPLGDDEEDETLLDFCEDESSDLEENYYSRETNKALYGALSNLNKLDRTIVALSYGLYDQEKRSNKEIGKIVHLSEPSVIKHRKEALSFLKDELQDWAA